MGTDRSKDGAHYFVDVVLGQGEFIYEISCFYVAGIYGSITLQTNVGSYTVQCGRPPLSALTVPITLSPEKGTAK
jgi:hypothetical protein